MATTSRLLQLIILRFSTHGEPENMTIGSTHNPPADLAIDPSLPMQPWAARFPNPPDLCFDYRRLLEQEGGVARATQPDHRICIVGAGVTGLLQHSSMVALPSSTTPTIRLGNNGVRAIL